MEKSIRVLQVVTHMERGGLETMLMNYYRNIDRSKVQFDFLVHRDYRSAYDDEIEALGGNIYRLPKLVPWSRSYQKALNTFFVEHPEYRIVHVHQDCLSSVILKAAKKNGVPVRIGHSHNNNQDKDLKYPIKLYYKRLISKYATDLFACGKEAGDWMFGGAPYRILNNAIDAGKYRFDPDNARRIRDELSIGPDALVIGHVGRFSPQKNHGFLIEVFAEILKRKPEARLLLVGDGNLRSQIEHQVKVLGLENDVIFTGVRSDVPELMQAMDIFLFPSLYEGLGIVIIEAQAASLPCVISNSIPEDCNITDLISRCDLEHDAKIWAQVVCGLEISGRQDRTGEVIASGFDIRENAQWLEQFYMQRW